MKVPSLNVKRLSDAFHLQPIQFQEAFSSARRGSILNGWKLFTKFNPGAKINIFLAWEIDACQTRCWRG